MTNRRRVAALFSLVMAAGLVVGLLPTPAAAAPLTAEPAVLNIGWWWKDAHTEERDIAGNKIEVSTPSPFCPSTPGSTGAIPGACAEGRFPVEIRGGDYDEPNMLSGLGFDLSMLTPGSKVIRFTVKLLEAKAKCTDKNGDGQITPGQNGDFCESTDPIGPVDEREVRACELTQIFGDAEGRRYSEVPDYGCSGGDPVAKRKEIKAVDKDDPTGIDHVWTFDLTPFARRWAEAFTVATNIMLVGNEPKETGGSDTWRVVFAGPKAEQGIVTELVYEPGELPGIGVPPPTTSVSGDGFGTTSGSSFGSGGSAGAPFESAGDGTTDGTAAPEEAASGLAELAAEIPDPEGMPAYVWLALLAGLIGFSLVRQVVIESTAGVRSDGVLAKIHSLNAERRGLDAASAAAAAEGPSTMAGIAALGRSMGRGFKSLPSKLPFGRDR